MTDDSAESSRSAEDSQDISRWDIEPFYYYFNGQEKRGKAFRNRSSKELYCVESHDGVSYKQGDVVYMEPQQKEEPFIVASIASFKMSQKAGIQFKVTRFFRPLDVPDISLNLILQQRSEICGENEDQPIEKPHMRELFSSEIEINQCPISSLRGKCEVAFVKDFRSLDGCGLDKENSFFSCLAYNHESSRLASVQGEIRVGASYQAKLPTEATCSVGDEPDRDELIYRPDQIEANVEKNYIHLARSFRMFAMIETKESVEKSARLCDLLFDDSIATLHRCGYKYDQALREMNERDKLFAADAMFMTAEDSKKFGKGLRTFGKNFVKINRELLPMHSRDQLVAYYYLWKKSHDGTKPKPLNPAKKTQNSQIKRTKNGHNKASRPNSTEYNDYSSAGEEDVEKEGKTSQYACHHCYSSTSRDWHHATKESLLLCTECRMFFKRYAQLRPVERPSTVPPCLFKRSPSGTDQEEEYGVKTRAGKTTRKSSPSTNDDSRSPSHPASVCEMDSETRNPPKHKNKRKKSHLNGVAKKRKLTIEEDGTAIHKESEESSENGIDEEKPEEQQAVVEKIETESIKEEPAMSDSGSIVPEIKEEVVKTEPLEEPHRQQVNGINGCNGVNGVQHDEEPSPSSESICEQQPSTSTSSRNGDESDVEPFDENEDNTWTEGDSEMAYNSHNASFVRRIVRKCGHRCSRTDFAYRIKPGGNHDILQKRKEEAAKMPPVTTPTATVPAVKKIENGMEASPRIAPNGLNGMNLNGLVLNGNLNGMDPNMAMVFLQYAQQAAAAQQAQQQQAAALEAHQQQQQQQMLKQLEMQRMIQQQQQQQQREAASRMMMPPFMDQRMALPFMQAQAAAAGQQHHNQQMEMLAAQQMLQQMAGVPPGANMIPPEMQQLLMQPQLLHMMQQQQMAMANPMTNQMVQMAQMGLHPQANQANVALAHSEMMRRLQQEAGQAAMRHQQ